MGGQVGLGRVEEFTKQTHILLEIMTLGEINSVG